MAGRLFLVRHGKTKLNGKGSAEKIRGRSKAPLDEEGKLDAEKAGEFLKSYKIDKIIASDMPRTQETAKIIGRKVGVSYSVDPGLGPWDLGVLTGKAVDKVWPMVQKLEKKPDMNVPDGETYNTWWKRYTKTLWKYIAQAKKSDENVLLITHARNLAAIDPVLEKEDSQPSSLEWAHAPEPGSVMEVCIGEKDCKAKLLDGKFQGKTLRS